MEPSYFSPFPITAPEPVAPAIQAGLRMGYDIDALDASTPIFQQLVRDVVDQQTRYQEEQLREWLRALIENPAGRRLIEEMLR